MKDHPDLFAPHSGPRVVIERSYIHPVNLDRARGRLGVTAMSSSQLLDVYPYLPFRPESAEGVYLLGGGRRIIDFYGGHAVAGLGYGHPDIIRTIERDHRWFTHYHTAGNRGRGDLHATQELNYPAIFRAIARTGLQGYIAHEFIPAADPLAALTHAHAVTREAFSEIH